MTYYRIKWVPSEENIKKLSKNNLHSENLYKIMQRQKFEKNDWWEMIFSAFLPENFRKAFGEFEANRNHIAHNKLIDRSAYKNILRSIDVVQEALLCGIQKMSSEFKKESPQKHIF